MQRDFFSKEWSSAVSLQTTHGLYWWGVFLSDNWNFELDCKVFVTVSEGQAFAYFSWFWFLWVLSRMRSCASAFFQAILKSKQRWFVRNPACFAETPRLVLVGWQFSLCLVQQSNTFQILGIGKHTNKIWNS